jgi:hypothetical protein
VTSAALVRRLEQFRRRESAVRALGVGMHATCIATAVAVVAARSFDAQLTIIFAAAAAAALTIVVAALSRRPLDRIAAAIDRHAQLSDRVLTAYEHRKDTDPVARLLIEDAHHHAASVAQGAVFPFRIPSRIGWTIAASVVAIVAGTATPRVAPAANATNTATSADDSGSSGERGQPNAANSARSGGKSAASQSPTAIPSPARVGAGPSAQMPAAGQQPRGDADASAGRRPSTPPSAEPASGLASNTGSRFGAKAAGVGTNNTASTRAAGAVSSSATTAESMQAPTTASSTGRNVTLAGGSATGPRALAPGMRAYVRHYFDAIKK